MLLLMQIYDLAENYQSVLIIGKPGLGKTAALLEIANFLSQKRNLNTVVVDKTCTLAGNGLEQHPAIGKAQWMPVGQAKACKQVYEAVENQS